MKTIMKYIYKLFKSKELIYKTTLKSKDFSLLLRYICLT